MFSSEQSYLGLVSLNKRGNKNSVLHGERFDFLPSSASETGIISVRRTDRHTDSQRENIPLLKIMAGYKNCISETSPCEVTRTCALFSNFAFINEPRSGGLVVDNTLDYQSRDRKMTQRSFINLF